jgi:hypothetical protein
VTALIVDAIHVVNDQRHHALGHSDTRVQKTRTDAEGKVHRNG